MTDHVQPAWLTEAFRHIGIRETSGRATNPRISAFYRDAGHPEVTDDAVAWCAAFVGACLARAGHDTTESLRARSYLTWGDALDAPRVGAIAVFSRGANPALGHVGFVVDADGSDLMVLGGNQGDAVSIAAYPRDRLLALRWPHDAAAPTTADRPLFDVILDHVFEMEGGYTDDPHDPGGPTNRGITLSTYAAWRRIAVSPDTFASLKDELKSLDRTTAAEIYRVRYWSPSAAEALPSPLALMHFDAAVNHGVAGASRILQQALGVEVDGEIGPETLGAAHNQAVAMLIDRYADLRAARYRALPHFWRFGRGWLNRVTKTRKTALALAATFPQPEKPPMTTLPDTPSPKWWGASMTIWGTLLTVITTVLPAIGPLFGIDITGDMITSLGHALTALIQAFGGVIGSGMAIYGRIRATQPLMRRPVAMRL